MIEKILQAASFGGKEAACNIGILNSAFMENYENQQRKRFLGVSLNSVL